MLSPTAKERLSLSLSASPAQVLKMFEWGPSRINLKVISAVSTIGCSMFTTRRGHKRLQNTCAPSLKKLYRLVIGLQNAVVILGHKGYLSNDRRYITDYNYRSSSFDYNECVRSRETLPPTSSEAVVIH
jgi:hypothetical protein